MTGVLLWIDIDFSRKTGWGGKHKPTVKDPLLALLDTKEMWLGMCEGGWQPCL